MLRFTPDPAGAPTIAALHADLGNYRRDRMAPGESPALVFEPPALGGQGFFSVARPVARAADGTASFDPTPMVSRAGDFSLDRDGYMVDVVHRDVDKPPRRP